MRATVDYLDVGKMFMEKSGSLPKIYKKNRLVISGDMKLVMFVCSGCLCFAHFTYPDVEEPSSPLPLGQL